MREVAILTTAREMDSQFEWVAHEPEALKEGVPQNVIDVIKYRRSTEGLDETDALIIELGRQLWRDHKVKPETFAKLKTIFGPNKLVELVMLMGNYAGTAALLTAVDMQLQPARSRCCRSPRLVPSATFARLSLFCCSVCGDDHRELRHRDACRNRARHDRLCVDFRWVYRTNGILSFDLGAEYA